eukprot:TRINITY_DN28849_c0_g1_i1.p2 TRINITY_DN28849_c0_g1~~TRINITY_DN28849_c0_g1_i1.p2  ORF type:complete len:360 (+),score=109.47 TRINITY_DN28849_c0_g1_i1:149-1081(+)
MDTEEQLRAMGCTSQQRKNLLAAAKVGLGPLKQLGLARGLEPSFSQPRSRSPVWASRLPAAQPALMAPPSAPSEPSSAVSSQASRRPRPRDEEEDIDLDGFLAAGRKNKKAATATTMGKSVQASSAVIGESAARLQKEATEARAREEEDRRRREREAEEQRLKQEMERKRLEAEAEEDRQRQERKKARKLEKDKRKAEKERKRHEAASDDADGSGAAAAAEAAAAAATREAAEEQGRCDPSEALARLGDPQRQFWGASVKGRVSNDNKGYSDADLDRRFGLSSTAAPNLMTEEEVLKMLRKGKDEPPRKK